MLRIIKHLFKIQFLMILVSILAGIYYPQILDTFKWSLRDFVIYNSSDSVKKLGNTKSESGYTKKLKAHSDTKELLFTKDELWKFNGADENTEIYLSILGSVFDVTRGRKHYGFGCTYNAFAGRDASASFITGDFDVYNEDSDNVASLKLSQIWELNNWRDFYHKEYVYKGKLIGRFFDEFGRKTSYHLKLDEQIILAKREKEKIQKEKEKFPYCNIEWKEEKGTRVWCTKSSGGIERNWSGVPRKFFENPRLSTEYRCACVNHEDLMSPKIKEYANCDTDAQECYYNES
ncbi:neuferricin homolog [Condylostylus longicornis]|uniref:neuferricin homolog n=1 Tax=Condylostylus longicornis TaxID=2530218 RepID=UPI00244D9B94|nr:neuferricin homolog [Condylostylus longicornis]